MKGDEWRGRGHQTDLNQHAQKRLPVLGPKRGQHVSWWEQAAAGVDSDLGTVTKVHTEILQYGEKVIRDSGKLLR